MGLLELGLLLFLMMSVAHYLYGWAVFAEKQIVLVQFPHYTKIPILMLCRLNVTSVS